jgi:NAD(P)-dependent dehydrogenase (short-subunit alcohol dehydrogenase family)
MAKVVLITGAAKGIGRAITVTMLNAGYDVVVNYRTAKEKAIELLELAKSLNRDAIIVYANMSNLDDIKNMYKVAIEHFNHIDVVVNNAGISSETYFLDATEADFDGVNSIDWKGLFFSSQFAAKHMIDQSIKGVIINLSSNQVDGCWPRATIYASVKAAVSKFTKNCAMELSSHNIRMVAIAPGYTDIGWEKSSHIWKAAKYLPMKRFAQPEEIASGVLYLASDAASYMTGTTLTIDGGATLPVVACNDFIDE